MATVRSVPRHRGWYNGHRRLAVDGCVDRLCRGAVDGRLPGRCSLTTWRLFPPSSATGPEPGPGRPRSRRRRRVPSPRPRSAPASGSGAARAPGSQDTGCRPARGGHRPWSCRLRRAGGSRCGPHAVDQCRRGVHVALCNRIGARHGACRRRLWGDCRPILPRPRTLGRRRFRLHLGRLWPGLGMEPAGSAALTWRGYAP